MPESEETVVPRKGLVKAEEVCRILNTTKQRVYHIARDNVLPPGVVVRIGRQLRFNEDALLEWINQGGSIHAREEDKGK